MTHDASEPVLLTEARTDFEAQTIVQALAAESVPAFVADAASADMFSALAVRAKVMVRRADLERAQSTLRAIRAESVDIDWEDMDPGSDDESAEALRSGGLSRRAMLTTSLVLLLPLAALSCIAGLQRGDPNLLAIGGAVAVFAVIASLSVRRALPPARESDRSGNRRR